MEEQDGRGREGWRQQQEGSLVLPSEAAPAGLYEGPTGLSEKHELAFQGSSGPRLTELGLELGY